ncbi:MAG TPA: hypothetical protein VKR53_02330 [Puia sp.]|nr:hypothetical protein [Puia sp.]
MNGTRLIILAGIFVFLIGAFYTNKFLQKMIQPRRSAGRLFSYIFAAFAIVFAYTFLLVWIVAHLFPVGK